MKLLEPLVDGERENAVVGWTLTTVVAVGALASFLAGDLLWSGFALLSALVIALPALSTRDWTAMVPWPLPSFVALAAVLRVSGRHLEVAGYVSIAAVALVVVVELDRFTPVELSRRFAVAFAVMTTMAIQGLWTIAQFYSDRWLGTGFLRSQTELQWDFVIVTVVGVGLGTLFSWYFDRFEPVGSFDRRPAE